MNGIKQKKTITSLLPICYTITSIFPLFYYPLCPSPVFRNGIHIYPCGITGSYPLGKHPPGEYFVSCRGYRQCLIGALNPRPLSCHRCAFRLRFLSAYPPLEGHGATGRTADRPGGTFVGIPASEIPASEIPASEIPASGIQASGIQASGVWSLGLPFWGTRPSYPVLVAESAVAPSRWL